MNDTSFTAVDYAAWRARVEADAVDPDFDFEAALTTQLLEGITIEPLYAGHDQDNRQPRGFVDNALGWHLTPRYEAADPEDVKRRITADMAGGATALWLRLDKAARSGVEVDGRAEGTLAARDGIALYHSADLAAVLDGVPLDKVALLLDAGANTLPATAALITFLDGHGIDPGGLEIHLNCDPLAALALDGTLPAAFGTLRDEMRQVVAFCGERAPLGTAVTVSDLPFHQTGASAVEELGIAAATLATYLRWLEAGGRDPEVALPYILLRSAVDRDLFTGLAKVRALRTLWGKIAGACGVSAMPAARIHAVTSDRPLTRKAAWVNMLRVTGQAVAAIAGGADFVTTSAWDRPLGRSTSAARRLARNTQTILGEESALGRVLDPAGGSHYVETLTDQLARRGWEFFQEIESRGGADKARASGWLAARLAATRQARLAALEEGRLGVTGVTDFADDEEVLPERELFDVEFAADRALERLRQHRDQRFEAPDPDRDCADLEELLRLARTGATFGEMSRSLRRQRGGSVDPLPRFRDEDAVE